MVVNPLKEDASLTRLTYIEVALSWAVAVGVLWLIYWNADLLLKIPRLGPQSGSGLPVFALPPAAIFMTLLASLLATLSSTRLGKGRTKWPVRIMVIFLWSLYAPVFLRSELTSPPNVLLDFVFTMLVVGVLVFGCVVVMLVMADLYPFI